MEGLGPFITYRRDRQERELAFRPFFYWKKEGKDLTLLEYLYPLGKYQRTESEVKSYFMPFYSTHRDLTPGTQEKEEKEKKERTFFLAFWGETEEGKSYGGFFPFYGKLLNRFGKDQVDFVLWPIYTDSREGESWAYNFLWPIFSYYRGGGREGFKVWPLLGYDRKENEYQKTFFLWPIFDFEKRYLYTDNPTTVVNVFPFYLSSTSSTQVQRSLLWPFFNYTRDQGENYTQWDFPWPFLEWARGEDKSILQIFPLYRRKHWEDSDTGYVLWPIYLYDYQNNAKYQKKIDRYFLLSMDKIEIWKEEGKQARALRIWPFFYYSQNKEGALKIYAPALLPLEDEGYERNWGPFLRLYEYNRNPEGASESKFLWGFYFHRKNVSQELIEVSLFLTYYEEKDLRYINLLRGLMEYLAEGSKRALRMFYLPWPVKWEASPAIMEAVSDERVQ